VVDLLQIGAAKRSTGLMVSRSEPEVWLEEVCWSASSNRTGETIQTLPEDSVQLHFANSSTFFTSSSRPSNSHRCNDSGTLPLLHT
jgi:hypothetical protein